MSRSTVSRIGVLGLTIAAGSIALMGVSPADAATIAPKGGTVTGATCLQATQALLRSEQVETTAPVDFTCTGDSVSATVNPGSARPQDLSGQVTDTPSAKRTTSAQNGASATAATCVPAPVRTISSELQDNIDFCVIYGQVNSPTNGSWEREIVVYWDMYPGWPSAQNRIQTIPSAGSPELYGTITSRKQNGILPPSVERVVTFSNTGNVKTTGYVSGLDNGSGSFSVALGDLAVTDPSYSFSKYIGTEIDSHRFHCDFRAEKCSFPNGQEAGL